MDQMEVVSLDSLLPSTHPYRRFQDYVPDVLEVLPSVLWQRHVSTGFF